MVDQTLVDYIINYQKQGYDINTLRNSLVKQGYDPAAVEAAITQATSPGSKINQIPKPKSHVGMLIGMGVVLVALMGMGVFGIFFIGVEEEPVEEMIIEAPTEITPVEPEIVVPEEFPEEAVAEEPIIPVEEPAEEIVAEEPEVQPKKSLLQMNADEIKIEIVRANKRIDNYGFILEESFTVRKDNQTEERTIHMEGIVDGDRMKATTTQNGQEIETYIQNETVYEKYGDTWVKEGFDEKFIFGKEIALFEASDIGILEKQPLDFIVSVNKEALVERLVQDVFGQALEVDFEQAVSIDAEYIISDELYFEKIKIEASMRLDNTTSSLEEIIVINTTREVQFVTINAAPAFTVPEEIFDAISKSEINITELMINITEINASIGNETNGNGTNGNDTNV